MYKRFVFLMIALGVLLGGCSIPSLSDLNRNEEPNEDAASTESKSLQETTEDEQDSTTTEDTAAESTEEVEEPKETTEIADIPDAATILTKSFQAMSALSSISLHSEMEYLDTIGDHDVVENRSFTATMALDEPYGQHFRIEIKSNVASPIVAEVYKLKHTHYIYSSHDHTWRAFPKPDGTTPLSKFIAEANLNNFLAHSSQFEVSEDQGTYQLTFSGSYEEFITAVYGGVREMLLESGKEQLDMVEDKMHSYHIVIDKETFLVKNYSIHYEGTVPGETGFIARDGYVQIDSYNQHDEIIVPEDIVQEATTMIGNDGE